MTGKYVTGAVIVLALFGSALTAQAGEGKGQRGAQFFERMDTDGNGEITRAEFDAAADSRFSEADANGDGLISVDEMMARAEARGNADRAKRRIDRMMDRLDANGDGYLSQDELAELRGRGGAFFERADSDGNGVITKAEAEQLRGNHKGDRRRPAE